jgi:hypothetical protein
MRILRIALTVIGILATLMGIVWIGQGSGTFPYPESSFMINQTPWITRGIGLAILGLALIWVSRRIRG